MLDDPPVLTVRRNLPRPDAAALAKIATAQTGHAVDCMDGRGAMDWRIKPLDPAGPSVAGRVITCQCYPADNLGVFAALELAEPGDVIVAQADGYVGTAVVGDLVVGMMKNKGVAAFVTDGLVRDLVGIEEVGLPVFTPGATPNSPAKTGPGTAGLPIVCGGVPVASGDVALCDRDGVVIIPRAMAPDVAEKLGPLMAAEASAVEAVKGGRTMPPAVAELLKGPMVQYVD